MPMYSMPTPATCDGCTRSVSIYSDEFEEWTWIEDDGDRDAYPLCRDCYCGRYDVRVEEFSESQQRHNMLKRLLRKRS